MTKFEIQHKETGLCMFTAHADSEDAAMNEYAGWRSGYDTFSEMCVSAEFSPFTNVWAVPVFY